MRQITACIPQQRILLSFWSIEKILFHCITCRIDWAIVAALGCGAPGKDHFTPCLIDIPILITGNRERLRNNICLFLYSRRIWITRNFFPYCAIRRCKERHRNTPTISLAALGCGAPRILGLYLAPKMAVPTRIRVEPSAMAASKSWLIPMESSVSGCCGNCQDKSSRSSRSWRK